MPSHRTNEVTRSRPGRTAGTNAFGSLVEFPTLCPGWLFLPTGRFFSQPDVYRTTGRRVLDRIREQVENPCSILSGSHCPITGLSCRSYLIVCLSVVSWRDSTVVANQVSRSIVLVFSCSRLDCMRERSNKSLTRLFILFACSSTISSSLVSWRRSTGTWLALRKINWV